MLDTDVLIDLTNRHPLAISWFATLTGTPHVAGFAAMEVISGSNSLQELRTLQKGLSLFPLRWPTEEDLKRALTIYLPLRLAHGIGLFDTVIAATATGAGLTLVTLNVRHFRHVPGLTILRPYMK